MLVGYACSLAEMARLGHPDPRAGSSMPPETREQKVIPEPLDSLLHEHAERAVAIAAERAAPAEARALVKPDRRVLDRDRDALAQMPASASDQRRTLVARRFARQAQRSDRGAGQRC